MVESTELYVICDLYTLYWVESRSFINPFGALYIGPKRKAQALSMQPHKEKEQERTNTWSVPIYRAPNYSENTGKRVGVLSFKRSLVYTPRLLCLVVDRARK
jgi:hypothetical protein